MTTANPFSPRFGAVPPVLAGRRDVLRDLSLVADGDLNSPSCASLLLGSRGMGKTTLLQVLEDRFVGRGWLALSVTARPGAALLDDLTSEAASLHHRIRHGEDVRAATKFTAVGLFGITVGVEHVPPPDLRRTLAELGRYAQHNRTGLLVTIDELQDVDLDEVRRFAAVFQHESSRNRLPIVFVGAGLLDIRDSLLAGRRSTFLHRCEQYEIDLLSRAESTQALAEPIKAAGASISGEALEGMLDAAAGHPYMLQTVGYDVWRAAADPAAGITQPEARTGLAEARRDMGSRIYAPIWRGLSPLDKRLLIAMLHDPATSHMADLTARWGRQPQHVASYRRRLILRGFIRAAGRGVIEFAHPEARCYAAEQAAEEGWTLTPDGIPLDPTAPGTAAAPD